MKEQDQVAALAELDWCPSNYWWCNTCEKWIPPNEVRNDETHDVRVTGCGEGVDSSKPYLTSYDAIIPLVKKCWEAGLFAPEKFYQAVPNYYPHILTFIQHTTPKELCEALLRATGKWIE